MYPEPFIYQSTTVTDTTMMKKQERNTLFHVLSSIIHPICAITQTFMVLEKWSELIKIFVSVRGVQGVQLKT